MGSPTGFARNPSPLQPQPYSPSSGYTPGGVGGLGNAGGSGGITPNLGGPPGQATSTLMPATGMMRLPPPMMTGGQGMPMSGTPPVTNTQSRYSQPAIQPQSPMNSSVMGNALGRFAGRL